MNSKQIRDTVKEDEDRVKSYFEGRSFTVERLDTKGHKTRTRRCDFRISRQNIHFLCEVESIFSILHGEMDFRSVFEKEIHERFEKSPARIMPYWVAISTHQSQLPHLDARKEFFNWLEMILLALNFDNEQLFCRLHYPWDRNRLFDSTATIDVLIGSKNGWLEFPPVITGGAMGYREKIEEKVEDAIAQLKAMVAEETEDPCIPRIVILSSHVAPPISGSIDMPAIATAMKNHSELSAIAVLRSVVVGQHKARRVVKTFEDFEDIRIPRKRKNAFLVFHSPYLIEADPLDIAVFDDGLSVQYPAQYVSEVCSAYLR